MRQEIQHRRKRRRALLGPLAREERGQNLFVADHVFERLPVFAGAVRASVW